MRSSGVVGGGRCVKRGGYVITLFREGLDGPPIFKVKKADEPHRRGRLQPSQTF